VIYLDASALVKLAVTEAESDALRAWLAERADDPRISSDLVRVEVTRAVMRSQPQALLQAQQVVSRLSKLLIRPELLTTAASLQPPALRSLNAIHLASAMLLRNRLTAFVGYDDRLNAAVRAAGLAVAAPGVDQ
jgi:predicted nucleic acid-binding protein